MSGEGLPRYSVALIAVLVALFVASGVYYAGVQNVWVDESTQLSGATLPLGRLLAWLAGAEEPGLGVPPDRMPPISYLIDAACYRTVCAQPYAFRILHVLIAAIGVALLIGLAARRFGLAAAAVTGIMLVLSPKMTELGVEIRAYPIFFTLVAGQIVLLARLIDAERLTLRGLLPLLVLGLVTIYTHFFGLVASMAILVGLFVARVCSRREAGLIIGVAIVLLALSAGLKPFVSGAVTTSNLEVPHAAVSNADRILWMFRLIGHPALMLSTPAMLLFFATLALLWLLTAVAVAKAFADKGVPARRSLLVALLAAFISGLAVTLLASFVVQKFNPLKPSYSIWIFPVLALLAGAGVRAAPRIGRSAGVAALLFAIGAVWTQAIFLSKADWFVHGPSARIAAAIGDDPRHTAVIYNGEWGFGFYPIQYLYHGGVTQWVQLRDGTIHRALPGEGTDPHPAGAAAFAAVRRVIAVDIHTRTYHSLRLLYAGKVDTDMLPRDTGIGADPALKSFAAGEPQLWPGLYNRFHHHLRTE